MNESITRRAMLAGVPGSLLAQLSSSKKPSSLPRPVGEFLRFADPVTETPVVRLTLPTSNSFLPAPTNRFVSVKGRFLICSSDRSGKLSPFQVDLHSGTVTQLIESEKLASQSLQLNQRQSILYYLDGQTLQAMTLANRKTKVLAENVSSFCQFGAGSQSPPDKFVVVRQHQLELLDVGAAPFASEVDDFCLVRPGAQGCLFRRSSGDNEREYWYVSFVGSNQTKPSLLARGRIANPVWSPDGQSLLFLRQVQQDSAVLSEIHSVNPENGKEQRLALTSQYSAFSPNADASVFVGASGSKAQPTVLLLLPELQRELTLCEHRASRAAAVSPAFSPDSKRVYFQSDHEGKSALYSVNVEALVEPTPSGD